MSDLATARLSPQEQEELSDVRQRKAELLKVIQDLTARMEVLSREMNDLQTKRAHFVAGDSDGVEPIDLATLERCFSCFNNLQTKEPIAKVKDARAEPGANGKTDVKDGGAHKKEGPKAGVRLMIEEGLISSSSSSSADVDADADPGPADIATFLFNASTHACITKAALGEYLCSGDKFQIQVLNEFIRLYVESLHEGEASEPPSGEQIVNVLRGCLSLFKLGGESQVIYRITDTIADHYYLLHPETFANQEQCMMLFYSIMFVNTELHNANIKSRRTPEQLVSQIRTLIPNANWPDEFYMEIIDVIQNDPLIFQDPVPVKKMSPPPAGAAESENPASLLMGPPGEPEMVGWLFKQGGNVKSWKKRWVVLSNFTLYYYANISSIQEKSPQEYCLVILEPNLQVREVVDARNAKRFEFELFAAGSGASFSGSTDFNTAGAGSSADSSSQSALSLPNTSLSVGHGQIKCIKVRNGSFNMGNHVTYRMAAATPGQRDRWVKKLKEALAKRVLSAVSTKKTSPDSMSSSLAQSGGSAAHQISTHSKLKWRANILPVPEPGLTEEALVEEVLTRLNSRRFASHPAEFLEYRDATKMKIFLENHNLSTPTTRASSVSSLPQLSQQRSNSTGNQLDTASLSLKPPNTLPLAYSSSASTFNSGSSLASYGPPGSYATTGRHPQNQPLNVTRLQSRRDRPPADQRTNPYIDPPASLNRSGSTPSTSQAGLSSTIRNSGNDNFDSFNTAPLSSTVGPSQQSGPQSLPVTGPLRQAPPPPLPPSGRPGNPTAPLQSHHRTLLSTRSQHLPPAASPLTERHPRGPNPEAHSAATSPIERLPATSSNPQSPTALLPSYMPAGFAAESMQASRAHQTGYNYSNPQSQQVHQPQFAPDGRTARL